MSKLEEILSPTSQVMIIMGIAEAIKQAGLASKYIPIIDVVLGIICGLIVYSKEYGTLKSVIIGLALGISGCGLFSGIKNLNQ